MSNFARGPCPPGCYYAEEPFFHRVWRAPQPACSPAVGTSAFETHCPIMSDILMWHPVIALT
jgi:hypothetical protein